MVIVSQPRDAGRFQFTDVPWRYIGFAGIVGQLLQTTSLKLPDEDGWRQLTKYKHVLSGRVRRSLWGVSLVYVAVDAAFNWYEGTSHYHLRHFEAVRSTQERLAFHALATFAMPCVVLPVVALQLRRAFVYLRMWYRWGPAGIALSMLASMPMVPDEWVARWLSEKFDKQASWNTEFFVGRKLEFRTRFVLLDDLMETPMGKTLGEWVWFPRSTPADTGSF